MTKNRPGKRLKNGVDHRAPNTDMLGKIEKTVIKIDATETGQKTYHLPSRNLALAESRPGPSPFHPDTVLEATATALEHGHLGPFLDGYHHALDLYREKTEHEGFWSHATKAAFLHSNRSAPRPQKTYFTSSVLWSVKTYAFWMGGLFPIPGFHHDNHGKRPRFGLTQLFDEVPGIGSAGNTGPALVFFLFTGAHLGLPMWTLINVLRIRVFAFLVGALGFFPAMWGDPFMASKVQAEPRIANIMETWVDLRARTEHDVKLRAGDAGYEKGKYEWYSENLSEIFVVAGGEEYRNIRYPESFRKAVWGHWWEYLWERWKSILRAMGLIK